MKERLQKMADTVAAVSADLEALIDENESAAELDALCDALEYLTDAHAALIDAVSGEYDNAE